MKQAIWFVVMILLLSCKRQETPPAVMIKNYDPDLQQTVEGWWYKGKPFSGYMIEEQRAHEIVYRLPIIDGKENGPAIGFYDSGEKLLECYFLNGKKEGLYKQWWPNGNYRYRFHFKNGKYHGAQTVFFPDGKIREESRFFFGGKEGLQRVWNNSGQLISNYMIRNKKLYGVISVETCLPGAGH